MKVLTSSLKTIFIIFILFASNCNDDNLFILFQDDDLTSIRIVQQNYSIAKGLEVNYTVIGTYLNDKTRNLSDSAVWISSDPSVADIELRSSSEIVLTAKNMGTTKITATVGAFSDSTNLTVTPPELVSISVTPENDSIAKGLSLQYTATGTYTDDSTLNLTDSVVWSSSDGSVAVIINGSISKGLAVAKNMGTTTITATSGAISGNTQMTVTAPELVDFRKHCFDSNSS